MADLSARALSLAIVALMNERARAIEAHNSMDPNDEEFEEIGSLPEEIDSVMGEFYEEYEAARKAEPAYPGYETLVSGLR